MILMNSQCLLRARFLPKINKPIPNVLLCLLKKGFLVKKIKAGSKQPTVLIKRRPREALNFRQSSVQEEPERGRRSEKEPVHSSIVRFLPKQVSTSLLDSEVSTTCAKSTTSSSTKNKNQTIRELERSNKSKTVSSSSCSSKQTTLSDVENNSETVQQPDKQEISILSQLKGSPESLSSSTDKERKCELINKSRQLKETRTKLAHRQTGDSQVALLVKEKEAEAEAGSEFDSDSEVEVEARGGNTRGNKSKSKEKKESCREINSSRESSNKELKMAIRMNLQAAQDEVLEAAQGAESARELCGIAAKR